jgi:cyanophycinase
MAKTKNGIPVPNGILFIVGGAENKEGQPKNKMDDENFIQHEVLQTFLDLIGKKDPVIEVITTASSEGEESFADYKKVFNELNVSQVGHIHHNCRREVLDDAMTERMEKADAFFFSGGDQLKLTSSYGGTTFLTNLKYRYINTNIVIGGTSAGAMAMSTPMIYAGNKEVQQITSEIKVTTGLEFLKDVCIDTHFVDRGRFIRIAQVILTNPTCIGMGIEEDTAVIVRNGREAEMVGSGVVTIMDGFHIGDSNVLEFVDKKPVSMRDLRVHLLSRGDTYNIPLCNPPHI